MKKWQESRNYRRVKNEDGEIIANIITVDGEDVEVTEEVFLAYSQMERRERYLSEDTSSGRMLSLEQLEEDDVHMDYVGTEVSPSAEECCLEREDKRIWEERKRTLTSALSSLSIEEQQLIQALFLDGLSAREYAKRLGVYHRTIIYRRDKLLEKLRRKFFS